MTFEEWKISHNEKFQNVLRKLKDKSTEEIIEYFQYKNMKINEPLYCELYALGEVCHDMENLNCFLCACPHFLGQDTPLYIERGTYIMSTCTIKSRFRGAFTYNKDDKKYQQCDCSNCHIPHKHSFVRKFIKNAD